MTPTWNKIFCGRDEEIEILIKAYQSTKSQNEGPQLVCLVADSGFGKTRIIQEFYNWLANENKPKTSRGYWPHRLPRQGNNLVLNPDPVDCSPKHEMPFLWWAIRLQDLDNKNTVHGALQSGLLHLKPHLQPYLRSKQLANRRTALARGAMVDIGTDIALNLLNMVTLGAAGIAKISIERGRELIDLERERRRFNATEKTHHRIVEDYNTDLVDLVLQDFLVLLEAKQSDDERVPIIVVFDDAQWIKQDRTAFAFCNSLIKKAKENNWPLLVIASHWEQEWNEDEDAPNQDSFVQLCRRHLPETWSPHFIGKATGLNELVEAGLPNLPALQTERFVETADGNPLMMDELLRYFISSPRFFEDRNIDNALNKKGIAEISSKTMTLHKLVFDRLSRAMPSIRIALGVSSVQGSEFVNRITCRAVEILKAEIPNGQDEDLERLMLNSLQTAQKPMAFITSLGEDTRSFVQRVYRTVARNQLEDFLDETQVAIALFEVLDQEIEALTFKDMTESEIDEFMVMLRSAGVLALQHKGSSVHILPNAIRHTILLAKLLRIEHDSRACDQALSVFFELIDSLEDLDCDLGSARLWHDLFWIAYELKRYEDAQFILETIAPHIGGSEGEISPNDFIKCALMIEKSAGIDQDIEALCEKFISEYELGLQTMQSHDVRTELARVKLSLAEFIDAKEGSAAAHPYFTDALSEARKANNQAATGTVSIQFLETLVMTGDNELTMGSHDNAQAMFEEAQKLIEIASGSDVIGEYSYIKAIVLERLAGVHKMRGNIRQAIANLKTCLTIREQLADNPSATSTHNLHLTNRELGRLFYSEEGSVFAAKYFDASLRFARDSVEKFGVYWAEQDLGTALCDIGVNSLTLGAFDQAFCYFQEAKALAERAYAVTGDVSDQDNLIYILQLLERARMGDCSSKTILALRDQQLAAAMNGNKDEERLLLAALIDLEVRNTSIFGGTTASVPTYLDKLVDLAEPGLLQSVRERIAPFSTEVPEFPFHAEWSTHDVRSSAYIIVAISLRVNAQKIADCFVLRANALSVHTATLDCYPNEFVVLIKGMRLNGDMGMMNALVSSRGVELVLNRPALLHALNDFRPPMIETHDGACSYARFFCWIVSGDEGPYQIVESVQHLPEEVLAAYEDIDLDTIFEQERVGVSALVHYGASWFDAKFEIFRDGTVSMVEDITVYLTPEPHQTWEMGVFERWLIAPTLH